MGVMSQADAARDHGKSLRISRQRRDYTLGNPCPSPHSTINCSSTAPTWDGARQRHTSPRGKKHREGNQRVRPREGAQRQNTRFNKDHRFNISIETLQSPQQREAFGHSEATNGSRTERICGGSRRGSRTRRMRGCSSLIVGGRAWRRSGRGRGRRRVCSCKWTPTQSLHR